VLIVLSRQELQHRVTVRFPSRLGDGHGTSGEVAVGHALKAQPARPSTWLFGTSGGIQVWAADGDPRVSASVYAGGDGGPPVILLNRRLVGTPEEYAALAWALERVAEGVTGFVARSA
jgi:hypothetical protein